MSLRSFIVASMLFVSVPATAAPAVQPQPVGPAPAVGPAHTPAVKAKIRRVRVRMELEVRMTTDGVGLNSEDEIYYFVVQPQRGDTMKIKEVRRPGDPDVFEMGPLSDSRLSRWLFRGPVSALNPMKLGLVVAEQDSSDAGGPIGTGGGGPAPVPFEPSLLPGMQEAVSRAQDRDHQVLSFVQITTTGNKLVVKTRESAPDAADRVLVANDDYAKVQLSAPGLYLLHVYLEPDTGPVPKGRRFLGIEDDDCNENKTLTVKGVTGDVAVPKAGTKVVEIGQQEFEWTCGGSEESAVARPGTQLVEVDRDADNDSVIWRCFKKLTLAPDIEW